MKIETRIGTLEFTHDFANGFPTDATVQKLYDERDFQRADPEQPEDRTRSAGPDFKL